jgi:predicted GH43/DUF377 family glycosyl hydrolase
MDDCCLEMKSSYRWEKMGLIFRPDESTWWMKSHAALPTPLQLGNGLVRVYFSSRDKDNRSHVGFFEINLENPGRVLRVSTHPVLEPGPLGYFDDHGIYAASAVPYLGKIYLYTIGWSPGLHPPMFYSAIGLAVSGDGGESFAKYSSVPIMSRSEHDPCLVTSPFVMLDEGRWRMWYVSGTAWERVRGAICSQYHIKYAESMDGVHWHRDGRRCIDHQNAEERNIARAYIRKTGGAYEAWYSSSRGQGYRLGYAVSQDGLAWRRCDNMAGLYPSDSGWDSLAVAYPSLIEYGNRLFLFYNGNNFGKDGVGLAVGAL